MSADRETNHDMTHGDVTHSDIALLLADAADEVDIGIAPYQAVVRGGRRRKARRWAVAATATLVIAGSTGSLALAGALNGDGDRAAPAATQPTTVEARHLYEPARTTLATGRDQGKAWRVVIEVWGAPRDKVEAQGQWDAMGLYGVKPGDIRAAGELVGKGWVFVHLTVGDGDSATVVQGPVEKGDSMSGADIQAYSTPLAAEGSEGAGASRSLVIGKVAPTVQQAVCAWDDDTTTIVNRAPRDAETSTDTPSIRPVDGSQPNWFVCVSPKGVGYKSVDVPGLVGN
ncbi:hypothetical protein [Streptomyces flaveus]|uniref:hypothetical protein n=1 Tax=Streptomyces flaveus TaxID=66370 RepID=UPI003328150F